MTKEQASQLIKDIAVSIKNDPTQFHFNVSITGMNVRAAGGSTGLIVSATGGGPGSNTTGLNVSLNQAQIDIARQGVSTALSEQVSALCDTLNQIAQSIEVENKDRVRALYQSLLNTWVPGVITSVVGNVLSIAMGISQ